MPNKDLRELPKFEDNWSYLYFEKGELDQYQKSVAFHYADKLIPIPVETVSLIMLGPGTTITHEAIKRISESRCLIAWTGDNGVRFYSSGYTGTYSSRNLLRQINSYSNEKEHDRVVRNMYQKRFPDVIPIHASIEKIRGMEGARVRKIYAELALKYNVKWTGRNYDQENWDFSDPINRALSAANACLYGVVQAAILSVGFSTAIGFVHTGKQLSFVYDIADLYKTETSFLVAFEEAKEGGIDIERRVRYKCRDIFRQTKLMKRIIPDMMELIYGRNNVGESEDLTEGRDVAINT